MFTNWRRDYVERMQRLALDATETMSDAETRYGMSWHQLADAVIALDRILATPPNPDGRIAFDLSTDVGELLAGLRQAIKNEQFPHFAE